MRVLLIDEYDNFANEIMMSDEGTYRRLVHADGPFKRLMKQVKTATEGQGIERLFLTGVTPVVLSNLTSGLNIAKNVSLASDLNALCGFTEEEIRGLLERLADERSAQAGGDFSVDEALEMMRTWYNGYRFAPASGQQVYNPTLALYFIDHLQREGTYPRQMLDTNLAADENKLRFLARETDGHDLLAEIVQTGQSLEVEHLADRFTLSEMLARARRERLAIASFLFYFGMLTIEEQTARRRLRLAPPNLVVRKLYIDELLRLLLEGGPRHPDLGKPARELTDRGDIKPLLQLIEGDLLPRFSRRDARWMNELAVKTAFMALLFQDVNYTLHSERRAGGGYADLVLLRRPDARATGLWDLLFEFKYVRLDALGADAERLELLSREELAALPAVAAALDEAAAQVERYREGLVRRFGDVLQLRGFAVVTLGFARLVAREVTDE